MPTALMIHAGIADRTMWEPQHAALESAGFRVVAPDLRGFGDRPLEPGPYSHVRDAAALITEPSAVIGASLGGRVALELAVDRPELVDHLALIAPGLPGWSWSVETRALWEAEDAAFEAGELERAAEVCLGQWVDGARRTAEEVDPAFRARVGEMILRSYEQQRDAGDDALEELLEPPVADRLGEIGCPTLVIVGDEDRDDMRALAAHVASTIPGAELAQIAGASHLPSLERPERVNGLLLEFLASS